METRRPHCLDAAAVQGAAASDLAELERILRENAGAKVEAFAGFLQGTTLSANQIQLVDLTVDYLTSRGAMKPERLYASPFTDVAPQRPDALFTSQQVDALLARQHRRSR